jgi:hypothetical protein
MVTCMGPPGIGSFKLYIFDRGVGITLYGEGQSSRPLHERIVTSFAV